MRRLGTARRVVDFDSSVNVVRATSRFLKGKGYGGLSIGPSSRAVAKVAASPPYAVRRTVFRGTGYQQANPLDAVKRIDGDALCEWVVSQYGDGPYDTVLVGSPSGAALHLAAALRAPFLPQTLLVSVRDLATHPDDPRGAMEALAPIVRDVAARNPALAVYQMHDPAQDRPMLETMTYLRLKRLALGATYRRFLEQRLAPGATIVLLETGRTWRSTAVGERAYFQFGCLGGLPEEEYFEGSGRVTDYLAREGAPVSCWDPPEPDGRRAEAEWGYDPSMTPDVVAVADAMGYGVRRLVVPEPQDASPWLADLYRWWYAKAGLPTSRLLVESYVQWDPFEVLRTASVPFWMRFNMGNDHDELANYLGRLDEPYDEVWVNLFSQGLWSPGVVPVAWWESLAALHARRASGVIGVDRDAYPADTGATARYREAFRSLPGPRHRLPDPLTVDDVDRFTDEAPRPYAAAWVARGE